MSTLRDKFYLSDSGSLQLVVSNIYANRVVSNSLFFVYKADVSACSWKMIYTKNLFRLLTFQTIAQQSNK